MTRIENYVARQVENIEDHYGKFEPGVVLFDDMMVGYVCPCGCGSTVTLFICSPGDQTRPEGSWEFAVVGDLPSLSPSVNQTGYPCRSHYFLRDGKVQWC